MAQQTFSTPGSHTWECPAGVTSLTNIECWGAGGAGGGNSTTADGGGGGGGGAYAASGSFTVTPGNVYNLFVGHGGSGVAGTNGQTGQFSWFNNSNFVMALPGTSGARPVSGGAGANGVGGSATNSRGATKFAGGNGGTGVNNNSGAGGGSGGSAGSTSAGGNGGNATAGNGGTAGSAGTGGGAAGVAGGGPNQAGNQGNSPGAGGSGSGDTSGAAIAGGNGANGQVKLTWSVINFGAFNSTVVVNNTPAGIRKQQANTSVNLVINTTDVARKVMYGNNLCQLILNLTADSSLIEGGTIHQGAVNIILAINKTSTLNAIFKGESSGNLSINSNVSSSKKMFLDYWDFEERGIDIHYDCIPSARKIVSASILDQIVINNITNATKAGELINQISGQFSSSLAIQSLIDSRLVRIGSTTGSIVLNSNNSPFKKTQASTSVNLVLNNLNSALKQLIAICEAQNIPILLSVNGKRFIGLDVDIPINLTSVINAENIEDTTVPARVIVAFLDMFMEINR